MTHWIKIRKLTDAVSGSDWQSPLPREQEGTTKSTVASSTSVPSGSCLSAGLPGGDARKPATTPTLAWIDRRRSPPGAVDYPHPEAAIRLAGAETPKGNVVVYNIVGAEALPRPERRAHAARRVAIRCPVPLLPQKHEKKKKKRSLC